MPLRAPPRLALLFATGMALFFSGCSSPLVLNPYPGTATVQTSRTLAVTVEPGEMYGRHDNLYFDVEDQYAVARHLEKELARLGIARAASAGEPEIPLRLAFVRTRHLYEFNEYILDVELYWGAGASSLKKRYHIRSAEGDSLLTQMLTDPSEGKQKAGDKLMRQMIPDIEAWLRERSTPPQLQP